MPKRVAKSLSKNHYDFCGEFLELKGAERLEKSKPIPEGILDRALANRKQQMW